MNPFKVAVGVTRKAATYAMPAAAGVMAGAPILNYAVGQNAQNQQPPIGVRGPAPDQPNRVGVQAPAAPAAAPAPPMPIPGDVGDHVQLRNTILGDLHSRMAKAQQAGDRDTLYDLAAQRGALDNGGFQGLAQHLQESATAKAQREKLSTDARGDQIGIMAPEEVWQHAMMKTGDERVADSMAQHARIAQNAASAKASGRPVQVAPDDARAVLAMKYPGASALFAGDEGQSKPSLGDLYHSLAALGIPGMNDPSSEFAQAARHSIRQLYGDALPKELYQPLDARTLGYGLPLGMGSLGTGLGNLFAPAGFKYVPPADFDRQDGAVKWWESINSAPAP